MGWSSWWYLGLNSRGLEQHPGGKPGDNQYSRPLEWGAGARVPAVFRAMGGGLEEKEAQTNQNNNNNNNRAGSRAKRDPALGSSPPPARKLAKATATPTGAGTQLWPCPGRA